MKIEKKGGEVGITIIRFNANGSFLLDKPKRRGKMRRDSGILYQILTLGAIVMGLLLVGVASKNAYALTAFDERLTVNGYLKEELSMNLQDPPEVPGNDSFNMSMARTTLWVDANLNLGVVRFSSIIRAVEEYQTNYLRTLETMSHYDLMGAYNDFDVREYYADIPIAGRANLRLGKQIVSWGKVDFFRAMDRINGEDWTWRSFIPSKEEIKKPLMMANADIQFPEINSGLQLIVKPGIDRNQDIGDTLDVFGGRWAAPPNRGFNFLNTLPYNYHFSDGDVRDVTGGVRFSTKIMSSELTLNWLRTLGPEPIANPNSAVLGALFGPAKYYKEMPQGTLGDLVFPVQDVFGITGNYYSNMMDCLMRTELAYIPNKPYQVGTKYGIPGLKGVAEKETLITMFAVEKNLGFLQNILGCREAPLLLAQYYDVWITNYDSADDIVYSLGNAAPRHQNDPSLTLALNWSYLSGRVSPGLAWVGDLREGGGLLIPSCSFQLGDHWRAKIEVDWFYDKGHTDPGQTGDNTYIFGLFSNSSQAYASVSYLF